MNDEKIAKQLLTVLGFGLPILLMCLISYRVAVKQYANNVANLYLLKGVLQNQDDLYLSKSVSTFEAMERKYPTGLTPRQQYTFGLALILLGRVDDPMSLFGKPSEIEQQMLFLQGNRYLSEGKPEVARRFFKIVASLESGKPQSWIEISAIEYQKRNLPGFLVATDHLNEFASSFDEIKEDAPLDAMWMSYWLGERHRVAGDFIESTEAFKRVLSVDSTFPYARLSIGEALVFSGDCAGAVPFLERESTSMEAMSWAKFYLKRCFSDGDPALLDSSQLLSDPALTKPMVHETWDKEVTWYPRQILLEQFASTLDHNKTKNSRKETGD